MSNAPVITPEGVLTILESVASSFGSCLYVPLTLGPDAFDKRVVFTLNNTDKPADPDVEAAFMKFLLGHQHVVAERLADARALSRLSGEDVQVHASDLSDPPGQGSLVTDRRPTLPDDDEEDEFDDYPADDDI